MSIKTEDSAKVRIEICRMLKQGKIPKEIRQRLNVPSCMVSYYREKLGIKKFTRGRIGAFERIRKTVRAMKISGHTYKEIGDALGISRQAAAAYLRPDVNNNGKCQRCNRKSKSLHRHHYNYSKDSVRLLCTSCHRIEDGETERGML